MSLPPPGWYTDPNDAQMQRWWDGERWSEHTQHASTAPAAPLTDSVPPPTPSTHATGPLPDLLGPARRTGWRWVIGIIAASILLLVISFTGGSDTIGVWGVIGLLIGIGGAICVPVIFRVPTRARIAGHNPRQAGTMNMMSGRGG